MTVKEYEYAGFKFDVVESCGKVILSPVPGQHQSAYKDKHLRAAREMYITEHKEKVK